MSLDRLRASDEVAFGWGVAHFIVLRAVDVAPGSRVENFPARRSAKSCVGRRESG
jgi:hypothetical protein